MGLRITSAINKLAENRFRGILKSGKFPEVNFQQEGGMMSYNMMEYAVRWATFMKYVDKLMKENQLDAKLGVYTRKHSVDFLYDVKTLLESISADDILRQTERYRTMFD